MLELAKKIESNPFSSHSQYLSWRKRLLITEFLLNSFPGPDGPPDVAWSDDEKTHLSKAICASAPIENAFPLWMNQDTSQQSIPFSFASVVKRIGTAIGRSAKTPADIAQTSSPRRDLNDVAFLEALPEICANNPCLVEEVSLIREEMSKEFRTKVKTFTAVCVRLLQDDLSHNRTTHLDRERASKTRSQRLHSNHLLIEAVNHRRIGRG